MKFAIGRKLHMTQIFDAEGVVHPVTIVSLEPAGVALVRSQDKDGYSAVQVAFGEIKKSKKQHHREFRTDDVAGYDVGAEITPTEMFTTGDVVSVVSTSKGKGFQGVVKRHGFSGGPKSHGQKKHYRSPGSIGFGANRVARGKKMPGRMGGQQVTIKGTTIMLVDKERNLLILRGSLPGRRGTLLKIQSV